MLTLQHSRARFNVNDIGQGQWGVCMSGIIKRSGIGIGIGIVAIAVLIAAPALAAKAKKKAKPLPPPVPVYSWTGFYVGANAGGACSNVTANRGVLLQQPSARLIPWALWILPTGSVCLANIRRFPARPAALSAVVNLATTPSPQIGCGGLKQTFRAQH